MGVAFCRAKGLKNKWNILFGKPDLIDPSIRTALEERLLARQPFTVYKPNLYRYIVINTLFTLAILFLVISFSYYLNPRQLSLSVLFILLSSIHSGAMLEQRKWVFYLDYFRLAVLFILASSFQTFLWINFIVLTVLLIILLYQKNISRRYFNFLYQKTN